MQDTIDYMHKVNPELLNELVKYGDHYEWPRLQGCNRGAIHGCIYGRPE